VESLTEQLFRWLINTQDFAHWNLSLRSNQEEDIKINAGQAKDEELVGTLVPNPRNIYVWNIGEADRKKLSNKIWKKQAGGRRLSRSAVFLWLMAYVRARTSKDLERVWRPPGPSTNTLTNTNTNPSPNSNRRKRLIRFSCVLCERTRVQGQVPGKPRRRRNWQDSTRINNFIRAQIHTDMRRRRLTSANTHA